MGLTVLRLTVANRATPDRGREIEFLIDSGTIYSVVPAAILEQLDINPNEQEFRLADGTTIHRRKGVWLCSVMENAWAAQTSSSVSRVTAFSSERLRWKPSVWLSIR